MAEDGRPGRRRASSLARGQLRAAVQPLRLALHAPRLLRAPRGDGSPVVVLPGLTTGDVVMAPLRAYLRTREWDARGWGLGTNDGRRSLGDEVGDVVRRVADERGSPVALVGWSLGGTIARIVAERADGRVDRVVTFGSPVRREGARDSDVPVTAVVSRRDGVVPFDGQVDDRDHVEVVEVDATHVGQTLSPDVWLTVARALARTD